MHIEEVMTRQVITVTPKDRVAEVAKQIAKHHISGVFVVDGDRLVGQISHADILKRVFPSYEELYDDMVHNIDFEEIQTRARELGDRRAGAIMSEDVMTVSPQTPVMKVAAWMLLRDLHRLAVVDDIGRLLGVVSRGDIFYHAISQEMAVA